MNEKTRERLMAISDGIAALEERFRNATNDALPTRHHTPLQVAVLEMLEDSERGWEPMGRIAGTVGISAASMSGLCDRMVALKLVTRKRDRRDRRQILVKMAPEGSAMLGRSRKAREKLAKELEKLFGPRDFAAISRLLGKAAGDSSPKSVGLGRKTRVLAR